LFLDDDTVILQSNFLTAMITAFHTSNADGIIPHGYASFFLLNGRYGYHEPYFPTSRCMAYKREVLNQLGGFVSGIIGQEDVEFSVRFTASGRKYVKSEKLHYFHPPLIVSNSNKAGAVGFSFAKLRNRYPLVIYVMLLLNGLRYLPLTCIPFSLKWKMQGRFSAGFLIGILYSVHGKKVYYQDAI